MSSILLIARQVLGFRGQRVRRFIGAGFCRGTSDRLNGWQDVKRAMRWCRPWYLALGAAPAFAVSAFVSVGQYVFDRVDWVAHSFGMTAAPQFAAYFSVPGAAQLLLFALRFPKRCIFRGLLQPRLIDRYGLYRGLFLVGIVWAAFHFFSDFFYYFGVQQVFRAARLSNSSLCGPGLCVWLADATQWVGATVGCLSHGFQYPDLFPTCTSVCRKKRNYPQTMDRSCIHIIPSLAHTNKRGFRRDGLRRDFRPPAAGARIGRLIFRARAESRSPSSSLAKSRNVR